jgi:hypothetical protein
MLLINCPHCNQLIEILSIACGIFRCGVMKSTGEQLPPHLSRDECIRLATSGAIYGCGGPFRIDINGTGKYIATICDYI